MCAAETYGCTQAPAHRPAAAYHKYSARTIPSKKRTMSLFSLGIVRIIIDVEMVFGSGGMWSSSSFVASCSPSGLFLLGINAWSSSFTSTSPTT